MAKKKEAPAVRVVQVNARLFVEDVDELKRRAAELGFREWHPLLRKLVHESLAVPRRVIK